MKNFESRFFFVLVVSAISVFSLLHLRFTCWNHLPTVDAQFDRLPVVKLNTRSKDTSFEDLWVGDIDESKPPNKKITIVISYCQGDLGWLDGFLAGHAIYQIRLISKCGNPIPTTGNWRKRAETIEAQNVGGNDQSVAAVLFNVTNSGRGSSDIYFFLKDNISIHRKKSKPSSRSIFEMLRLALARGFACFQKPARGFSQFHDTHALKSFKLKKYRSKDEFDNSRFESIYANMSEWLDAMNLSLPARFTPVCYGGSFAVKSSQIFAIPGNTWLAINQSLSRSNNIEEGHFAERTWAGIFSLPLSKKSEEAIGNRSFYVNFRGGEIGALVAKR